MIAVYTMVYKPKKCNIHGFSRSRTGEVNIVLSCHLLRSSMFAEVLAKGSERRGVSWTTKIKITNRISYQHFLIYYWSNVEKIKILRYVTRQLFRQFRSDQFVSILSRDTYTYCRAFDNGAETTCFYTCSLGLSSGDSNTQPSMRAF